MDERDTSVCDWDITQKECSDVSIKRNLINLLHDTVNSRVV